MFHKPPPSLDPQPNRKRIHQHHESKKWVRLPADKRCLECFPIPKPFLETVLGRLPSEIRVEIFKAVLKVGSISPLEDGISVPVTRTKQVFSGRGSETKLSIGPAGPASCLALLQTCRQIYQESSLLFYAINTFYLCEPREITAFLRSIGRIRCDEIRSLHIENARVTAGKNILGPNVKGAMRELNNRGNLRKLYLDMQPHDTLAYIKLCADIPGFRKREIVFHTPARWSVMPPSTKWGKSSWYTAFVRDWKGKPFIDRPYYAYWLEIRETYRVEVDILPALPEGLIVSKANRHFNPFRNSWVDDDSDENAEVKVDLVSRSCGSRECNKR